MNSSEHEPVLPASEGACPKPAARALDRMRGSRGTWAILGLTLALSAAAVATDWNRPAGVHPLGRALALNPGGGAWQYLTYAFVHLPPGRGLSGLLILVLHLGANLALLAVIAPPLERRLGVLGIWAVYAVAAVGGGLCHRYATSLPQLTLAGGCGAICGLAAAGLVLAPAEWRRGLALLAAVPAAGGLVAALTARLGMPIDPN
ncbi:MAG: rhomboid family intramembrane serine protease, partial [bacterium]|nr:rhomboid family intramembrane serine protease [bacterium]